MLIYINGYWNRVTGMLGLTPGTPDESYWNYFSPIFISTSRGFMNVGLNESNYFVDGSSLFGIDQYAGERYQFGHKHAEAHFDQLTKSLRRGESFKFISHSEGGAFASGMADYLLSKGQIVEKMLFLSPREGDDFKSPRGIFAIQAHFINDPICFPKRINGVAVYIVLLKLDGKKAGLRYAHGGTVKSSTLKKVQKIIKKLPVDSKSKVVEGQWNILETMDGFEFKHLTDLVVKTE